MDMNLRQGSRMKNPRLRVQVVLAAMLATASSMAGADAAVHQLLETRCGGDQRVACGRRSAFNARVAGQARPGPAGASDGIQ